MSPLGQTCPCGSNEPYSNCCQVLHQGMAKAQTAEQLMRSRYSAYALKLIDYLVATTHPEKQTASLRQSSAEWAGQVTFYRLEIVSIWKGLSTDKVGKVEFIAHYRYKGEELRLHETSRFKRHQKQWVYLDGEIR